MKHKIIIGVASLALMALMTVTVPAITPIKAQIETNVEAKKTERAAKVATTTKKRVEIQQEVAKRKAEKTAEMLKVAIERLEKLLIRIEARIARVKAGGGVIAEAEKHVSLAKTSFVEARSKIAAFANIDLSGEKAKENFDKIREAGRSTKEGIRAAHMHMVEALRSLNMSDKLEVRGSATSSATTTAP